MNSFFNFNFNIGAFDMGNWFMSPWSFPTFQMPVFNISDFWFTPLNQSYFTPQITQPSLFKFSDNKSYTDSFEKSKIVTKSDNLKLDEYNASKGERLANIALNNSIGWTGYCARFVKKSIQAANLGNYKFGHAYQMTDILKNNNNFKEIASKDVDVSKLPAGCVLVYDKGAEGYSKNYGHTEITTGDGRAVSDGITTNLHKKPSAIFVPV